MKIRFNIQSKLGAFWLAIVAIVPNLHAQLAIPYDDGSDGALIITSDTVIDLSQAASGSWINTSASPGNGTYDPVQWAVVFKYSSVIISNGASVSFLNSATHAPVVWLVQSNVMINGELNLDGQAGGSDSVNLTEPGPGGFRGGGGPLYGSGSGFGPGGGDGVGSYSGYYGNAQVLPLIGGSGGVGNFGNGNSGGGGGGAILIAASGTITVNGNCHANGGNAYYGGGSGGGIRLLANQVLGSGTIQAVSNGTGGSAGGPGTIRLESAQTASTQFSMNPSTIAVQPDVPPIVFPAPNAPTVTIWSVAGQAPPADPKAAMSSAGNDDLTIITTNNVTIQVRTTNFPTNGSTVNVYIKPRNAFQTVLTTTNPVSGDTNAAIWEVSAFLNYQINQGHTIIQARAFH